MKSSYLVIGKAVHPRSWKAIQGALAASELLDLLEDLVAVFMTDATEKEEKRQSEALAVAGGLALPGAHGRKATGGAAFFSPPPFFFFFGGGRGSFFLFFWGVKGIRRRMFFGGDSVFCWGHGNLDDVFFFLLCLWDSSYVLFVFPVYAFSRKHCEGFFRKDLERITPTSITSKLR